MRWKGAIAAGLTEVLLLSVSASPAAAWGREGHEIVARIAAGRLTPNARRKVEDLIGHPAASSMATVSTWADDIRRRRRSTAPWHFVNIELGSSRYVASRDCPRDNCVVAQIVLDERTLANARASRADKVEALKFLIHFVGDIHQPLHCADDHDRGGNEVRVRADGRETNLHHIWDTEVVEQLGRNPIRIARHLSASISRRSALLWAKGRPADWANGSFAIARDKIYGKLPENRTGRPIEISQAELHADSAIAAVQLQKAGVRLAAVLNKLFR